MKYRTFSKSALVVTLVAPVLAVLAACANSADVPPEETTATPTEPPPAETTKLPPSSTPPAKPEEKKCPTSCKTDLDCTNACPALAGGVQCCDPKTFTCWGSKTSSCPKPADEADAGDPPPAY